MNNNKNALLSRHLDYIDEAAVSDTDMPERPENFPENTGTVPSGTKQQRGPAAAGDSGQRSRMPKGIQTQTQYTPDDMMTGTVPANKADYLEYRVEEDVARLNPDAESMGSRG